MYLRKSALQNNLAFFDVLTFYVNIFLQFFGIFSIIFGMLSQNVWSTFPKFFALNVSSLKSSAVVMKTGLDPSRYFLMISDLLTQMSSVSTAVLDH